MDSRGVFNMKTMQWILLGALSFVLLSGCAKKPAPVVVPVPPKVEVVQPPPVVEAPKGDEAALRRQRIQAKIAEVFKTIYFTYDQSLLTDEGKATCEAIGQLMKEALDITVRLEGHADDRGTNEYNLALGESRGKAVQAYLASYGVAANRLSVISYGEEKPALDGPAGQDEGSWAKNRRVEFTPTF